MVLSYNGWVASEDPRAIGVVPLVVNGVSFPGGVRGGDIHTIFEWLFTRIDQRVETLRAGWCWGFDYRKNRNADNLSCHSSGTAGDVNAPLHPNGATGTWNPEQVTLIRADLAFLEGVVTWGLDFQGVSDEMHFEIATENASEADLARVARKIRASQSEGDDMPLSDTDKEWITNAIRVGTVQDIRQRDLRLAEYDREEDSQFAAILDRVQITHDRTALILDALASGLAGDALTKFIGDRRAAIQRKGGV